MNTGTPRKSPFWPRLLSVVILDPIVGFATFTRLFNGLFVFLVMLVIAVITSFEFSGLMERRNYRYYLWLNTILITLSCVSFYLFGLTVFDPPYMFTVQAGLLTLYVLCVMLIESVSGSFEKSMENIGISLFAYVSLAIFCPTVILIKMMDQSGWILAMALLLTWLTDAGGLWIGKIFGRTKLYTLSSPNKTAEGYLGAILFGLATGGILFAVQNIFAMKTSLTIWQMAIVTVICIFASIVGDLGESTVKRWAKTKDSSDLLPGHGGFFDRFDSIIYTAPAFYVVMKLFGY